MNVMYVVCMHVMYVVSSISMRVIACLHVYVRVCVCVCVMFVLLLYIRAYTTRLHGIIHTAKFYIHLTTQEETGKYGQPRAPYFPCSRTHTPKPNLDCAIKESKQGVACRLKP